MSRKRSQTPSASARETVIETLKKELADDEKTFLVSLKAGQPNWSVMGIEGIEKLPAIQWKLTNIRKMVEKEERSLYVRALAPETEDTLFVVGESGTTYEINLSTSDNPDQNVVISYFPQVPSGSGRAGPAGACSGSHALDDAWAARGWA